MYIKDVCKSSRRGGLSRAESAVSLLSHIMSRYTHARLLIVAVRLLSRWVGNPLCCGWSWESHEDGCVCACGSSATSSTQKLCWFEINPEDWGTKVFWKLIICEEWVVNCHQWLDGCVTLNRRTFLIHEIYRFLHKCIQLYKFFVFGLSFLKLMEWLGSRGEFVGWGDGIFFSILYTHVPHPYPNQRRKTYLLKWNVLNYF